MRTAKWARHLVVASLFLFVVGVTTSAWSQQSQQTWGKNVPTQSQLRAVFEGGATLPLELHMALNKGFPCKFESDKAECQRIWDSATDAQRIGWNTGLLEFLLYAGLKLGLYTPAQADPDSPDVLTELNGIEKFGEYWLVPEHTALARLLRNDGALEKRIAALEGRTASEIEEIPCAQRTGKSEKDKAKEEKKKDTGEGETEKVDLTPGVKKKDAKVASNGD